jgi:hypothetical protein
MDLKTVNYQLPIGNTKSDGNFDLMWHRALERHQAIAKLTSLRGGDSRTFYIHPQNRDKSCIDLAKLRDLIAQGLIPEGQQDQFDLIPAAGWEYPKRSEDLIFLLKGRNTPQQKLERCLHSLKKQSRQGFGVILIEDGGSPKSSWSIPLQLEELSERTTLIRRDQRLGYLPNFIEAIEDVCDNPDALIVILDQDDALMSDHVVQRLLEESQRGADLINGTMFRPEKPVQLYPPTSENARRKGGGNVWAHLRAFRKSLFERVPKSYFLDEDGSWIDTATDYVTMLPMAEVALRPVHIDDIYCYYHERDEYLAARKERSFATLQTVFSKPSLDSKPSGSQRSHESVRHSLLAPHEALQD